MTWRVAFGLVVILVVAVFAAQNSVYAPIQFFTYETQLPVSIIGLIGFAVGAVGVGLLGVWQQVGSSMRVRGLQGNLSKLQEELANEKRAREEADNRALLAEAELKRAQAEYQKNREGTSLLPEAGGDLD